MVNYSYNAAEDTLFHMKKTLNCRGRLLDLSTPVVMGIVNVTPDSFHDGGRIQNEESLLRVADEMLNEGAAILDVGGQSTRPRSTRIQAEEEWKRIDYAVRAIHSHYPHVIISVDTYYSEVARKAIDAGATMINDISAGGFDDKIYSVAADACIPYIAMHMQGEPGTMQDNPFYSDLLEEVLQYFVQRIERIRKAGVHDIIIDPGFGFGKSVEHNYSLLGNLNVFRMLGFPVLAGLSRKSMITKVLNINNDAALNGTTTLNTIALLRGASILRVHDVKEAVEAIKLVKQLSTFGASLES